MRVASGLAAFDANDRTDTNVGGNRHVRRPFAPIMKLCRRLWRSKVPEQLAAITGHSTRSCERWLAGHVDPDGPATLLLMLSPHGPALIEAKVAELPAKEQTAFWEEMKRAARRHELRLRRAKIEAEERDLNTDRLF